MTCPFPYSKICSSYCCKYYVKHGSDGTNFGKYSDNLRRFTRSRHCLLIMYYIVHETINNNLINKLNNRFICFLSTNLTNKNSLALILFRLALSIYN